MSNPETTETASDLHVSASVCVVGVLAEALAQHREGAAIVASYTEGRLTLMEYSCSCGWRERSNWADGSTHPAHVASVVAALPNIATVMLPESHPPSDLFQDWWTDDGGWTVERHVGSPQIRLTFDEDDAMETSPDGEFYPFTRLTASEAYDLGTALLAAAWAARAAGGQALLAAVRERDNTIARVRALHVKGPSDGGCSNTDCKCHGYPTCLHCNEYNAKGVIWPCATIAALDPQETP